MINFLVYKIFEKTKQIIENFDEEPVVQKLLIGEAILPVERITFIDKYFSDAREELFRGRKDLKEKYLDSFGRFLNLKYQEGGRSVEFAKRLLLPVKNTVGESQYTQENFRQWRLFALDTALSLKGPTSIALQTKDGNLEAVSFGDLQEVKQNSESRSALNSKLQVVDGKFVAQDGSMLTADEAETKTKEGLKKQTRADFESSGFSDVEIEMIEEAGGATIHVKARDQAGDEFVAEKDDDGYFVYESAHPEQKERVFSHELTEIKTNGIKVFLAKKRSARKTSSFYVPQGSMPIGGQVGGLNVIPTESRGAPGGASEGQKRPSDLPKTGGTHTAEIPQFGGVMKAKEKLAAKKKVTQPLPPKSLNIPYQMPARPKSGAQSAAMPRKKKNSATKIIAGVLGGVGACGGVIGAGLFLI